MYVSNIRINLPDLGIDLDYENPESLNIRLNRIVDDFNDPSKRYSEFSYTFSLPKTKINARAFEFPDVKGRTRVFNGKIFNCKLYNGNDLVLDGLIELTGFNSESFKCVFYSKFVQLADDLKGKKLSDMTALPTIVWEYEKTIVDHIRANAKDKDYEFVYAFYKTPFVAGADSAPVGPSSNLLAPENLGITWNYYVSTLPWSGNKNPVYHFGLPPAIYLRSIINGMFQDAGWTLSGSFFDGDDVSKIVIPFAGDTDSYLNAITKTGATSYLNLNRLLPDVGQMEFLSGVLNAFNLYFIVNPSNKTIRIEPWTTFFSWSSNPYDITDKVDGFGEVNKTLTEPIIMFEDDNNNKLVNGFGQIMDYAKLGSNEIHPTYFLPTLNYVRTGIGQSLITTNYDRNAFNELWNKTTGNKEIKLSFSPCNFYSYTIGNERSIDLLNINSAKYTSKYFSIGVPLLSPQTPSDNKGIKFAPDTDTDYCQGNNADAQSYDSGLKMLYYYGPLSYNVRISGATNSAPYYKNAWIGIATGGTCSTPTFARVLPPIASPFRLLSTTEATKLRSNLAGYTTADKISARAAEAHGLLNTFYSVGTTGNTHTTTRFSLTLGTDSNYENLYTVFHEPKYRNLTSGLFSANMRMTSYDWSQMQMSTPIKYNDELYQLVEIQGFDPVNQKAKVTLLKKA